MGDVPRGYHSSQNQQEKWYPGKQPTPLSHSAVVCVCVKVSVSVTWFYVSLYVYFISVCVSLRSWLCACVCCMMRGKRGEGLYCALYPWISDACLCCVLVSICMFVCIMFLGVSNYVCMCSKPICLHVFSPQIPWLLLEHFSLTHSATPSCGHVFNLVISEKGSTSEVSGSNVSDSDTLSLQLSRALTLTPWVFYILGASSPSWLPFPVSLVLQVLSLPLLSPHTLSVLTSHFYLTQLANPQQCSWAYWRKITYSWVGGWVYLNKVYHL